MFAGFAVPKGPGENTVRTYSIPAKDGGPSIFGAKYTLLAFGEVRMGLTREVAEEVRTTYGEEPQIVEEVQILRSDRECDLVIITRAAYDTVHGKATA